VFQKVLRLVWELIYEINVITLELFSTSCAGDDREPISTYLQQLLQTLLKAKPVPLHTTKALGGQEA
jgi:hypothetical protein